MKIFGKLLFLVSFIMTFIFVGDAVVDALMTLFPASASEWFLVIRFFLWVFSFGFNLIVTFILYFIFVYLVSVIINLFD